MVRFELFRCLFRILGGDINSADQDELTTRALAEQDSRPCLLCVVFQRVLM